MLFTDSFHKTLAHTYPFQQGLSSDIMVYPISIMCMTPLGLGVATQDQLVAHSMYTYIRKPPFPHMLNLYS